MGHRGRSPFLSLTFVFAGLAGAVLTPEVAAQRPQANSDRTTAPPTMHEFLAARTAVLHYWNTNGGWAYVGSAASGSSDEAGITLEFRGNKVFRCLYKDNPDPQITSHILLAPSMMFDCQGQELQNYASAEVLKQQIAAWRIVARGPAVESGETVAEFDAVAAKFRTAPESYTLPEPVRELKVQAEMAVEGGHFADAVDRFSEALAISPWWPAGHYNLALMYGELKLPALAIAEMKKYLKLVPQASNARAAQDMIYRWRAPPTR
jgi:hypothetical protein